MKKRKAPRKPRPMKVEWRIGLGDSQWRYGETKAPVCTLSEAYKLHSWITRYIAWASHKEHHGKKA